MIFLPSSFPFFIQSIVICWDRSICIDWRITFKTPKYNHRVVVACLTCCIVLIRLRLWYVSCFNSTERQSTCLCMQEHAYMHSYPIRGSVRSGSLTNFKTWTIFYVYKLKGLSKGDEFQFIWNCLIWLFGLLPIEYYTNFISHHTSKPYPQLPGISLMNSPSPFNSI